MTSCDFGGGGNDLKRVIYSGGLQTRVCRQLGEEVKEMEKYFELLMGAFLQCGAVSPACGAVSPASLSKRKLPPSFTVLLLANEHKFCPFGSNFCVIL